MFQTGAPKASLVDLNVLSVPSQSTSAGIAAGYHYTCLSVMHLKIMCIIVLKEINVKTKIVYLIIIRSQPIDNQKYFFSELANIFMTFTSTLFL